jgi:hypothetical protein
MGVQIRSVSVPLTGRLSLAQQQSLVRAPWTLSRHRSCSLLLKGSVRLGIACPAAIRIEALWLGSSWHYAPGEDAAWTGIGDTMDVDVGRFNYR